MRQGGLVVVSGAVSILDAWGTLSAPATPMSDVRYLFVVYIPVA